VPFTGLAARRASLAARVELVALILGIDYLGLGAILILAEFKMAHRVTTARTGSQRRRPEQLELPVRGWGGRRAGAGRPSSGRARHAARPALASRFPVHVTLKVDPSLPNLRSKVLARVIERCLRQGKERDGFRLVHFSVQAHHLHLIIEALNAQTLSAGAKGLSVRLAKRLNATLGRKGRVFVERYFSRILRTPTQTRAAIAYVLLDCRRHDRQRGRVRNRGWIDPCSSGRFFDGWREIPPPQPTEEAPCVSPRLWLLQTGWRLRGLISVNTVPGG
jgi:REP element-mobilizing transposase RayT